LASGSADGYAYIYNTTNSTMLSRINFFSEPFIEHPCIDCKFGNRFLAASSLNGAIKLYKLKF